MQDHSIRTAAWNEAADYEMANQEKRRTKTDQTPLTIQRKHDESEEQALARTALNPLVHSAVSVRDYVNGYGGLDLNSLVDALEYQVKQIEDGNLDRIEEILTAQAHTLDAIFNNLVRRGATASYIH